MSKYVGQIPLYPPLSRGRKIGKFPLLIKFIPVYREGVKGRFAYTTFIY